MMHVFMTVTAEQSDVVRSVYIEVPNQHGVSQDKNNNNNNNNNNNW